MSNREDLLSELNKAVDRTAEIRNAEDVDFDALSDATVALDSLRSELAAFDAKTPMAIAPAAARADARSFGERAADALSGSPIGSSFQLEDRILVGDPTGAGLAGATDVAWADQAPGIRPALDAYPPKFIDIVPVIATGSDTVSYIRENGFTNNSAERLQGATTAESDVTFSKVTKPILNVAHYLAATEELLADAPALASLINQRGVQGVRSKVNELMLWDPDGAGGAYGGDYTSVVDSAAAVFTAGSDLFDDILQAKTVMASGGANPTHIVTNPNTWMALVNSKLGSGEYVGATPFSPVQTPIVWGLPVIVDNNLDANTKALIVDNTQIGHYVRSGATVASERDLLTGVVRVRVQVRSQFAVFQPQAVAAVKTTAT